MSLNLIIFYWFRNPSVFVPFNLIFNLRLTSFRSLVCLVVCCLMYAVSCLLFYVPSIVLCAVYCLLSYVLSVVYSLLPYVLSVVCCLMCCLLCTLCCLLCCPLSFVLSFVCCLLCRLLCCLLSVVCWFLCVRWYIRNTYWPDQEEVMGPRIRQRRIGSESWIR